MIRVSHGEECVGELVQISTIRDIIFKIGKSFRHCLKTGVELFMGKWICFGIADNHLRKKKKKRFIAGSEVFATNFLDRIRDIF